VSGTTSTTERDLSLSPEGGRFGRAFPRHRKLYVPKGRLIVARRFNAGVGRRSFPSRRDG
jgi:hypothetical protein